MRKRIYWLLPDLDSARTTMNDLLLARIDVRHIHFVAREDADMRGLHAANVLQTSDVVRSAEIGLIVGAGLGDLPQLDDPVQHHRDDDRLEHKGDGDDQRTF